MRVLSFTQIVDDRFDNNLEEAMAKIEERIDQVFYPYYDITVHKIDKQYIDFPGNKQIRAHYFISKSSRKHTWNDIMRMVNSIKAVPYEFINIK